MKMPMSVSLIAVSLLLGMIIAGCSASKKQVDAAAQQPASEGVAEISEGLADVDAVDKDLDTKDLDTIEDGLNSIEEI